MKNTFIVTVNDPRVSDLKKYMNGVLRALDQNRIDALFQSCILFGRYLNTIFPGATLDSLEESLADFTDYNDIALPPLRLFKVLHKAQITTYEKLSEAAIDYEKMTDTQKASIEVIQAFKNGLEVCG